MLLAEGAHQQVAGEAAAGRGQGRDVGQAAVQLLQRCADLVGADRAERGDLGRDGLDLRLVQVLAAARRRSAPRATRAIAALRRPEPVRLS